MLRERAREVSAEELASPEIQTLIDDMIETMRAAGGAGLAANQVGETVRVAVAEVDHNPRYPYKPPIPLTVFVNPVVEPIGAETVAINEGCLSVPDIRGELERYVRIRVRYLDRDGVEHDEEKVGLTAGTFQHEVDHLDGVLFLDRVEDTTTLTTWSEFESSAARSSSRGSPSSSSGSARERPRRRLVVRARLARGRARRGRRPDRDRRRRITSVEAGHPKPPAGADSPARPDLARGSPTPTRTRSSARCAGTPTAAAAPSGAGATRCTRSPRRSTPTATRARPRDFAEMALAGITAVGEFHYLHHGPGGKPLRRAERDGRRR